MTSDSSTQVDVHATTEKPQARPPLRVYVAGASAEFGRVGVFMDQVAACGAVITYDWPSAIVTSGKANVGLTRPERVSAALDCLEGVRICEVLVLLAPLPGSHTIGAFIEVGRAMSMGKLIIWVGDAEQSVFSSLAAYTTSSPADALALVASLSDTFARPTSPAPSSAPAQVTS